MIFLRIIVFSALFALLLPAQAAKDANRRYQTKEGRDQIAATLADPHRDERQKPVELVAALGLKPGHAVADLGTGVGYLLPFLSRAVGPAGKVVGQDIQFDFIERAEKRAKEQGLKNVTFVVGSDRNPRLPERTFDVVFTLDSYHHFDYPGEMLPVIAGSLKPGGRFVICDFYKRPGAMPNGDAVAHVRLDKDDVIKEVEANGFRLVSQGEHIPGSQYLLFFEKK